jgi:hypothetical protein
MSNSDAKSTYSQSTEPLWLQRAIAILREKAHLINSTERTQITLNRAGDHVEADINIKSVKAPPQ